MSYAAINFTVFALCQAFIVLINTILETNVNKKFHFAPTGSEPESNACKASMLSATLSLHVAERCINFYELK